VDHVEGFIEWNWFHQRIAAKLPLQAGATAMVGKKRLRLDHVSIHQDRDEVGLVVDAVAPEFFAGDQHPDFGQLLLVIVQEDRIMTAENQIATGPTPRRLRFLRKQLRSHPNDPKWEHRCSIAQAPAQRRPRASMSLWPIRSTSSPFPSRPMRRRIPRSIEGSAQPPNPFSPSFAVGRRLFPVRHQP